MNKKYIALVYVLVTFYVSACTTLNETNVVDQTGQQKLGRTTENPYSLIATDLVGALLQTKTENLTEMEVSLPFSHSKISSEIENILIEHGVVVNSVEGERGNNLLTYSIDAIEKEDIKNTYVVTLFLGQVGLKREYILTKNYIEPISSLYVRGAPLSDIELKDDIFVPKPN